MKKSDNTHSEHEFLCLIHEFIFGTTTAHLILDPPFIIKSLEKISQTTLCKQKKEFFENIITDYKTSVIEFLDKNNYSHGEICLTKKMLIHFYSNFSYNKVKKEQELIVLIHRDL